MLSTKKKEKKNCSTINEPVSPLEMTATLAHEIRNLLGGIEGCAALLARDLISSEHQKMLKAILDGTRTLNHLVTHVLDYARPLKLHVAHTDLILLIQETLDLVAAKHPNIAFHFVQACEKYYIGIDPEQIKLVLLNVLHNAIEAGSITIHITLTQNGTILIKDNGSGISAYNLEKIFTPFFTTKTTGTGLGLAQALSVVEAHGGTLQVSSQENEGTEVTISL